MNRQRMVLLSALVFLFVLAIASPMPMGESEQSFVVEDGGAYLQLESDYDFQSKTERDFFIQKGYTMSALTTNIEYMDEVDGTLPLGSATVDIALGRDYVMTRTMFTFEAGTGPWTDDAEDTMFSVHWKDANELTLTRGDNDFASSIPLNNGTGI